MAYTKHTWTDGTESDPSKGTVINASKLDDIENELEYLDDQLSEVNQSLSSQGEEISEINQSLSDISSYIPSQGQLAWLQFNTSESILTQVENLTGRNSVYFGAINSYGNYEALDMPSNSNFYLMIFRNSATYIRIIAFANLNNNLYSIRMSNGSWGSWEQYATS